MRQESVGPNSAILNAIAELWQLPAPGPDNILTHPAFLRLVKACGNGRSATNPFGFISFLSLALRSLGLPCTLQTGMAHLAIPIDEAAQTLDQALRATETRRVHLAPLDLADELPELVFGSARVCRLTPDELRSVFDYSRLKRLYPRQALDADRFSEFHWLVVEETVEFKFKFGARVLPSLSVDFGQDFGRIEPHKGQFPSAFEDALFFLLLEKWEEWSTLSEFDWRGFRVPWVHTVDHDLFVRPYAPRSPDTLSWEPRIYDDGCGGTFEEERPIISQLDKNATAELTSLKKNGWKIVEQARHSILFETPVVHFLIRAFLSDGVDEFLAHITTIESALGMQADYNRSFRVAEDRHRKMKATKKLGVRIAGLLDDRQVALEYYRLFNVRSAYLHGRVMKDISTKDRVLARSLARQVVEALIISVRQGPVLTREEFLDDLVDKGKLLL